MPQPRKFSSNAERQAAYRARRSASESVVSVAPGPAFGVSGQYMVRIQHGSCGYGVAVFDDRQRAALLAKSLQSAVLPGVSVEVVTLDQKRNVTPVTKSNSTSLPGEFPLF